MIEELYSKADTSIKGLSDCLKVIGSRDALLKWEQRFYSSLQLLTFSSFPSALSSTVQQCFHDLSFTHAFNSERTIIFRCFVNSICHHAKLQTRHFQCNHFFVDIKIVIFYLHKTSSSYCPLHVLLVSYIVTTHLFMLTSKCLDLESFSLT